MLDRPDGISRRRYAEVRALDIAQAERCLKPGTIMLGHANHPTVLGLFDRIENLIRERGLQPMTLDEMFGTSRATGSA